MEFSTEARNFPSQAEFFGNRIVRSLFRRHADQGQKSGIENRPHNSKFLEMAEAAPADLNTGLAISLAADKAAEFGDPVGSKLPIQADSW